jgi:hypothetical protein
MRSSLLYQPGDPDFVVNPHLVIGHDMEVVKDYVTELRAIQTQEDIRRLVEKWSGLIPECKPLLEIGPNRLPFLKTFLTTPPTDQDEAWVAAQDKDWMRALVPPSTLRLVFAAARFGVTTGVILLQLLANDCYDIDEDGDKRTLRLALPERKEAQPDVE